MLVLLHILLSLEGLYESWGRVQKPSKIKSRHIKVETLSSPPASVPQTFADVDKVLVSYFTFRALKDTLAQIQETDLSPGKRDYK